MTRTRLLWLLAVVAGASCIWWTGLRADDVTAVAPPLSQAADLLARIEKLERRVQTLEGRPHAVQLSTHAQTAADEWVSPAPPASPPNQPQFGIVYQLKRFIPEPPSANQPVPTGAGQKPLTFGDVEIRR
ncbi:MAG: hypothetical protein H7062_21055 [Candidatus Saccharimonas sp.]|nr:hypothetical protein [Planctomycetaceae bacterium]